MAEVKEFVTPPFLQGQSIEDIHRRMMDMLPADIDRAEGGFPWDFTRPTASEKAEYVNYNLVNAIRGIFAAYCDPYLLDYHADQHGLKRRAAQPATGQIQMTGNDGTEIPAGFAVSTEATYNRPSITFLTDQAVTLSDTPVTVGVTAADPGAAGNVGASTIIIVDTPIKGLATITNQDPTSGGIDEESDDSLRERILEYEQSQGISYVGSNADYHRWAMEVTGVGAVRVQGGQDGDCTVKLIITGSDGNPATEEVCQAVYDHIMRPDDESQRLAGVCDLLIVTPAEKLQVTVAATITLNGTAQLNTITEEFRMRLSQYYKSAGEQVQYTRIGAILLECAGVADYYHTTLLINGAADNIPVAPGQIPVTSSDDISLVSKTEG